MSLLSMAGMTNISSKSYEEHILSLNPIAYWPFDESSGTIINDLSGSEYHGTIQGGSESVEYNRQIIRKGSVGAMGFIHNKNANILFPRSYTKLTTIMGNDNTSTICGWIRVPVNNDTTSTVFRTGLGSQGARYGMAGGGRLFYSPSAWFNPDNNQIVLPSDLVPDTNYFFAWVKDSPNQLMYVYINGVYYFQTSPFTYNQYDVDSNSLGLFIGYHTTNNGFRGNLSDLAMFEYALTNEEIEQIYLLGKMD